MGGCRTLDACASDQETVMLEHLIVVPPVEEDPHHKEGRVLVRPESDKMRWCDILLSDTWGPQAGTSSQG